MTAPDPAGVVPTAPTPAVLSRARKHHAEAFAQGGRGWGWQCLTCGQEEYVASFGKAEAAASAHEQDSVPPKPSRARKTRGYATQRLVADWFRTRGWPYSESTGAGRSGVDVTGLPGLACEVKATARENVTAALRQAVRNAGAGLPFVVYRPNGMGPERMSDWPVIVPLDVFTELLHSAGYGSEQP